MEYPVFLYHEASLARLLRLYKSISWLKKRTSCRIWFLTECRRHAVFPPFINMKTNTNTVSAKRAIHYAHNKWLQYEIDDAYTLLHNISARMVLLHSLLNTKLHRLEFDVFDYDNRSSIFIRSKFLMKILINKLNIQIKKSHNKQVNNPCNGSSRTRSFHYRQNKSSQVYVGGPVVLHGHNDTGNETVDIVQHNSPDTISNNSIEPVTANNPNQTIFNLNHDFFRSFASFSQNTTYHKFHERVLNLTTTQFTHFESNLLNKGLKYSPSPVINNANLKSLIIHIEDTLDKSKKSNNTNNISAVRRKCIDVLHSFNNFSRNKSDLTLKSSLHNIKRKIHDGNILISKADKGNCVVIMDKVNYINKVNSFLSNNGFDILPKDPYPQYLLKFKRVIKESNKIFDFPFNIIPMNPTFPRLYGLPKIHKPECPIRPVCSFTNSLSYNLTKFLLNFLSQNLNFQPSYSIKNTRDLVKILRNIENSDTFILISFDVKDLFTSIPTTDCIDLVKSFLSVSQLNTEIQDKALTLLQLALEQNFFKFNNQFYRQTTGLAMGNPLSPLLAEIFMDSLEKTILQSDDHKIICNNVLLWTRYVDDVLCLWKGTEHQVIPFLNTLNSLHPNINFTYEIEVNKSINFLDLTILRSNNKLSFSIYRKPTHTDHCIPKSSCHPDSHKYAAFFSYFHRLYSIPLSYTNFQKELHIILQIAIANEFQLPEIYNILKKVHNQSIHKFCYNPPTINTTTSQLTYSSLPYIHPLVHKLSHFLHSLNINISFKSINSLGSILVSNKDPIPPLSRSGVYQLFCKNCESTYIGQSGRQIGTRLKEHKSNSVNNKSHFASHLLLESHEMRDEIAILHNLTKSNKLNIAECLEIYIATTKGAKLTNEVIDFKYNGFFSAYDLDDLLVQRGDKNYCALVPI